MEVVSTIAYIFLSFILTFERTLARSVLGQEALVTEKCTYFPADIDLPCKQYSAESRDSCETDWLRSRFHSLYEVDNSTSAYWPGKIQDLDASPEVIRWRPPTDASTNYLRGFYVQLSGNSFQSFGRRMCTIVDLSNITEDDIASLMNITFVVNISAPGTFIVKVVSLPPAPVAHKPLTVDVQKPPTLREYHPQILKQSVEYRQLNATCVNITVVLEPQLEDVNELYLMVLDEGGQEMEDLSQTLPYPEKFYILDGFDAGNFNLTIWPIDQFLSDLTKCVCYWGTEDERACTPCDEIHKRIHIDRIENNDQISEGGPSSLVVVAGAVTGSTLWVLVILATICFLARRHGLPCALIDKFILRRKSVPVDGFPKLRIFFVFSLDNPAHTKAVKALIELVKSFQDFEIIHFEHTPSLVASSDSLSSEGFRYDVVLEQADIIIVVSSAWANALLEDMEMKTVYASDAPSDEDCRFISCMHQIKQNASYCSKIVAIRFEYSPATTTLIGAFTGLVYSIPLDLQSFVSHIYSKSEFSCPNFTQSFDHEKDRLKQAISSCFAYQCENRNWLAKKMFLLNTYISSDDSGIVAQRRRTKLKLSKSVRSKSADTVSSSRCCSESQARQSHDRTCCINQLKRPRTLSCDFSFSPPESEREDQSIRYSLLENKFVALNEKYEYILNYKLNSEEDCYTIDGKSV